MALDGTFGPGDLPPCRSRHTPREAAGPGGVTLLAINNSRTQPSSLGIPTAAERYTLTAPQLEAATVQLNGHDLRLGANDALPTLRGSNVPAGTVTLAPTSITFLTIAGARNASCR